MTRLRNPGLNAPFGAQCFPTVCIERAERSRPRSQCTFWCSVLSDTKRRRTNMPTLLSLNAPFGAQCFPTEGCGRALSSRGWSQCTFWCSVLSDTDCSAGSYENEESQCTFWCSVLSDNNRMVLNFIQYIVSMHLLVLSAFRPGAHNLEDPNRVRLNAPFGAQCFPTSHARPA